MTAWTNRCLNTACPHGQPPVDWRRPLIRLEYREPHAAGSAYARVPLCSWECAAVYVRRKLTPLQKQKEAAA